MTRAESAEAACEALRKLMSHLPHPRWMKGSPAMDAYRETKDALDRWALTAKREKWAESRSGARDEGGE